jgi:hypothetical protein
MKLITGFLVTGFFGLLLISACTSADRAVKPVATATPTETRPIPTPSAPGDFITWRDLRVGMERVEATGSYLTEYGSIRDPSAGQQFFWVHVHIQNVGESEIDLPLPENFSLLYLTSEYKPGYGHRQGYTDYTTLGSKIFPGKDLEAWLRFELPAAAGLPDPWFIYLPESSRVGASASAPNYPWRFEHPMFAWMCAQK